MSRKEQDEKERREREGGKKDGCKKIMKGERRQEEGRNTREGRREESERMRGPLSYSCHSGERRWGGRKGGESKEAGR